MAKLKRVDNLKRGDKKPGGSIDPPIADAAAAVLENVVELGNCPPFAQASKN